MQIDFEKIREKNIEEYGKGTRHLSYFADIYSTRTHFIYELVQNAEDALSRRRDNSHGYIHFDLHEDRLLVRHNGEPFVEKDILGICGIGEGSKIDDYTQIGKFGIGFKSVYAYTFFPQIHSRETHFEISRFVEPFELNTNESPFMQADETCIVLPFDFTKPIPEWAFRDLITQEQAVNEIGDALRNLGARSLLFMKQITEIKWTLSDGTTGHFILKIEKEKQSHRLVTLNDGANVETWIVFRKTESLPDGKDNHNITVEVAFLIEDGKIRCAQNTELVVYFPTEKQTGLGFLIHAPFKTTKARDNIKSDDLANKRMIEIAAQLVADNLEYLCKMNLLDVQSYLTFPLKPPTDGFFRPI
ncbi:MAG: hypothetical protein HQM12_10510 [SAR324 cluster bacterium]|nr:hypothetical protein [SAR324 cluster bacterium]